MDHEALTTALRDIFDLKLDYDNTIYYAARIDGERIKTNIPIDSLFDGPEQLTEAGELLLQLITHDRRFENIAEFIIQWGKGIPSKNVIISMITFFEKYVKDIIGILHGPETRSKLDKTRGLKEIIDQARNSYGLIGDGTDAAFNTLHKGLRNNVGHGNVVSDDILQIIEIVSPLYFACLLHIISRCSVQLNNYLAGKTVSTVAEPVNEDEIIDKYVALCSNAFSSYLKTNVLHGEGADVSLIPVFIEETTAGSGSTQYDAQKFLTDAPEGTYIILGVPGAGKSTLLNSYLLSVCNAYTSGDSDMVPLLINASEVQEGKSFIDTLHVAAAAMRMDSGIADRLFDEGRLALAIDGINEFRPGVDVSAFLRQVKQHARGRVVMTGRIYEYASVRATLDKYGEHRVFQIQDISSETIRRFVETLNFDEDMSRRIIELFANDRILGLLSCPLNLRILISTIKEGGRDFNFRNRGGLIGAFVSQVSAREELDKRAGWLLENFALRTVTSEAVSVYDFAGEAVADNKNVYSTEQDVREKLIEPLVRAGILQKVGEDEIQFRLDTFREYFLARIYAESFVSTLRGKKLTGRKVLELPQVNDDNNNETFRLMLEILDAESARDLTEKLFDLRCGKRIQVPVQPNMFTNKVNQPLRWICDLARTLDAPEEIEKKQPNARMVCGNWVANNIKILLDQKADTFPEVYTTVVHAAASLCTERVIRFITGDKWLGKMIRLGLAERMANIIAAEASDARLVYRILSDSLPKYRGQEEGVGAVLRNMHRKLLYGMKPLTLEMLHRDIGRRIGKTESRNLPVPTEMYADYYLSALLTRDMELINAVPSTVVERAEPSMRHSDYDRLLDSCAIADTQSEIFDFFAHRTDKYKKDINLLVYVVQYLAMHHNENFAAALLGSDAFVKAVEDRYYSDTLLRKMCSLLPIQLVPGRIAEKLYESSLLKIALRNAEENNFTRNIRLSADQALCAIENNNLYFNTAFGKAHPNSLKTDVNLFSIDGKDRLTVVCSTLAETSIYIGAKATLGVGSSTLEGTVEQCGTFDGDYFEMEFGFSGIPVSGLRGKLGWTNSELQQKGWLEYSLCVSNSNTMMLRFSSPGAMNQLRKKEVREALTSPLTVFRIGDKLHIPLRSFHYPKVKNGTRISIRLDKPLPPGDKSYLYINNILIQNADGKGIPMFQQNYTEGANKSARSLLFVRTEGTDEALMLFGENVLRNACANLWVSVSGNSYHARVQNGTETFGKVLECADFELSYTEIPPCGTVAFDKTEEEIKYYVSESDGKGKFRLFLLADAEVAARFADSAAHYPVLRFADGTRSVLQHAPAITDHSAGCMIKLSLHGAPDDIMEQWTATPRVDFNVLRPVINNCNVQDVVYRTSAVPYFRRDNGVIEIPVPANAGFVKGMTVYVNDRERTSPPCTVQPLTGINKFVKTMPVELKNPAGIAPAIDSGRGLLFLQKGAWLEYINVLNVVQFDSGKLYHPDMVRPVIEAMIQNDDTELDNSRLQFFRDSMSEHLLMLYDVTSAQIVRFAENDIRTPLKIWELRTYLPFARGIQKGSIVMLSDNGRVIKI